MKLTAGQKTLLERLSRGPKLRIQVEGSGSYRIPDALIRAGLARIGDDPYVKDPGGYPAQSYFITDSGRAALDGTFVGNG